MIIFSQNKDEIVNFDNIINIMITDCDGDFVISAVALVGVDDVYRELGYYKTEEKAKEVLQEIVNKYKQWNKDNNNSVTVIPKVYEMPKE
ncbi:MAG: hypothetical protein IJ880_07825 [Bacilli bacterium]|nr:hypothetical protein [Bacilli bacterium]